MRLNGQFLKLFMIKAVFPTLDLEKYNKLNKLLFLLKIIYLIK